MDIRIKIAIKIAIAYSKIINAIASILKKSDDYVNNRLRRYCSKVYKKRGGKIC